MDSIDDWLLCEELTVMQAALLLAGYVPSGEMNNVEDREVLDRPARYEALKAAISVGLRNGGIHGQLVFRHV